MNGRSPSRVSARTQSKLSRRAWALALGVLIACIGTVALSTPATGTVPPPPEAATLPDPLASGPYSVDRSYYYAGTLQLTVTSTGTAPSTNCPTGTQPGQSTKCPGNTFPQPLEGSVTYPTDNPDPSKVILLLHGRHAACKSPAGLDTGGGTGQIFATGECPNKVPVNPAGPSGPEEPGDQGSETGFWPSWQGYNYISDLLASQGYTVVSPSAGALVAFDGTGPIDAGAFARSEIIASTLDLMKGWNEGVPTPAPTQTQLDAGEDGLADALVGKLDFSSVGMMGHSRGGEGVTQFIEFNRQRPAGGERYNLTSVFSLAPIDRNKHFPRGTNFATLLPACDGDVSTLSGANAFERGRYADLDDPFSKLQYYVEGANHNFYNTRWPSSDRTGSDPACGTSTTAQATSIRLTPSDQRLTGLATMPTFLRAFSGGESQFLPYLTDEAGYPQSACPQGPESATVHLLNCDDVVKTSYIAPADERQDIIRPDSGVKPTTADPTAPDAAGGRMVGTGFSLVDWCNPDPFATTSAYPPATQPTAPNDICEGPGTPTTSFNRSFGPQFALAWDGPATLSATLRGEARDASDFEALSFRASVQISDTARNPEVLLPEAAYNPRAASKYFTLALVDRDGNSDEVPLADVYPGGLESSLGSTTSTGQPRHEVLNGFRIPMDEFDASVVDMSDLDRVEVRFGGAGQSATGAIQFSTLAFQEPAGTAAAAARVPLEPLPGDRDLPPVDGLPTGNPAASTPQGSCVDETLPEVLIQKTAKDGHLVRGFASDEGCAARNGLTAREGKVERVQVTVAKQTAKKGKCRFLADSGELLEPTSCSIPLSIIATGKKQWRVKLRRSVPKGRYRVIAMAIDHAGNRSRISKSALRVR